MVVTIDPLNHPTANQTLQIPRIRRQSSKKKGKERVRIEYGVGRIDHLRLVCGSAPSTEKSDGETARLSALAMNERPGRRSAHYRPGFRASTTPVSTFWTVGLGIALAERLRQVMVTGSEVWAILVQSHRTHFRLPHESSLVVRSWKFEFRRHGAAFSCRQLCDLFTLARLEVLDSLRLEGNVVGKDRSNEAHSAISPLSELASRRIARCILGGKDLRS